jgi:hypothetical protein
MGDDWRKPFHSWSRPGNVAHPDSPAGGTGPGFSRPPGSQDERPWWSRLPGSHPDSPLGRHVNWPYELKRLEDRVGTKSVWDEIEETLLSLYSLPHNRKALKDDNQTPQAAAKKKVDEVRSGLATVTREDFSGPMLFLRVVGPANRTYSGEWWFDASLLDTLETAYSRVYFVTEDRKRVLRDMLRELLAIANDWNKISEIWALELPAGQVIRGYWGPGSPQKLFANLPLSNEGNRMLVGKARQVFFPVKNPLWVKCYQNLA